MATRLTAQSISREAMKIAEEATTNPQEGYDESVIKALDDVITLLGAQAQPGSDLAATLNAAKAAVDAHRPK